MSASPLCEYLETVLHPHASHRVPQAHEPAVRKIREHPELLMDALAEEGLVRATHHEKVIGRFGDDPAYTSYRVIPFHKHSPTVWIAAESGDTVVGCNTCEVMVKVEWPT